MFAAMFLCNISYGATIKELLGNKKSIKLSCVIENSGELSTTTGEQKKDTFVGNEYYIKIDNFDNDVGDFYVNGRKKTYKANISDDYFEYFGDDKEMDNWYKINRVTGVILIVGNVYHDSQRSIDRRTVITKVGSCRKATEQKF